MGGKIIVFCQCSYNERKEQTLRCVERMHAHVPRIIIIAPEPENEWTELHRYSNVEYCQVPWEDNFPNYRNAYVNRVPEDSWICYSDPDELYSESLAKHLASIIETHDRAGYNHLFVNSHDVMTNEKGETTTTVSSFFKGVIFKKIKGSHYIGVGPAANVHEGLVIPNERQHTLGKQYYYEHSKLWWEVWERASRNVFIGGGGNNRGTENPSWKPLREICDSLGLDRWEKARAYFRKGNIDPRLKAWLMENSYDGLDFQHEQMEFGRWYFEYLHPEENEGWAPVKELIPGSRAEILRFVENTYLEVLGRHASDAEKEHYANLIAAAPGLPREKLKEILHGR